MVLSIANETCNAAFDLCVEKNTYLDSFKSNFSAVLLSQTNNPGAFSRGAWDKNISSLDEFKMFYDEVCPQNYNLLKNGVIKSIDYRSEYEKYLNERGCKNSAELKELNKTDLYTLDELKDFSQNMIASLLGSMSYEHLCPGDADYNCAIIMKKASLCDLADFYNDCARPKESRNSLEKAQDNLVNMKAFKKLINKLPEDILKNLNLAYLNEAIDKMIKILEKKVDEEKYNHTQEDKTNLPDEKSNGQIVIDLR